MARRPPVDPRAWASAALVIALAFAAGAQEQAAPPGPAATSPAEPGDGEAVVIEPVITRVEAPPEQRDKSWAAERIAKLKPVPDPPLLEKLEQDVREQYREQRAQIDEYLAAPEPKAGPLSWAYGHLGMWAQAYRYFDTARIAYANAELLRPQDHRWPYLEGYVERRAGDTAAARAAFARAHAAKPDDVPSLAMLAELDFDAYDLDAAQAHVDAALELDPGCALARLIDGRIAYEREDYEAAVRKLRGALRLEPGSTRVRYALGLALRGAGKLERAETVLSRAEAGRNGPEPRLLRDPVFDRMLAFNVGARSWTRKGRQASKRGDHAAAIEYFGRALALDPDRIALKNQYARALAAGGRSEEAIEIFEEVLAANPDLPVTRYSLAVAYTQEGRFEKAEPLMREAIEQDPRNARAHFMLGRILQQRGRDEESLSEYQVAISIDPSREVFRLDRAIRLTELGRHAEAIAALEQDVKAMRDAPALQILLSRLLSSSPEAKTRDGARSLALLKELGMRRENLATAETRAMAYAETGDFESAIAWQKAAIDGAQGAAPAEALAHARQRLASYEQGKPCRVPWFEGEQANHEIRVQPPQT